MLEELHCRPVPNDFERIEEKQMTRYLNEIPSWDEIEIDNIPHLQKTFTFTSDHEVMLFTQKLMAISEEEQHHPEIMCQGTRVKVMWWTHDIDDLHVNDFIMAAKTDVLFNKVREFNYLQ